MQSLLLLVIEAGIDIDINMLKLIGGRGVTIAFFGSIFPIGIGIMIGIVLGLEAKAAIAAGACFGPTSLGIALNILRTGGILNT
jgi:Kef-type K+ transport system membrane component KefB